MYRFLHVTTWADLAFYGFSYTTVGVGPARSTVGFLLWYSCSSIPSSLSLLLLHNTHISRYLSAVVCNCVIMPQAAVLTARQVRDQHRAEKKATKLATASARKVRYDRSPAGPPASYFTTLQKIYTGRKKGENSNRAQEDCREKE